MRIQSIFITANRLLGKPMYDATSITTDEYRTAGLQLRSATARRDIFEMRRNRWEPSAPAGYRHRSVVVLSITAYTRNFISCLPHQSSSRAVIGAVGIGNFFNFRAKLCLQFLLALVYLVP